MAVPGLPLLTRRLARFCKLWRGHDLDMDLPVHDACLSHAGEPALGTYCRRSHSRGIPSYHTDVAQQTAVSVYHRLDLDGVSRETGLLNANIDIWTKLLQVFGTNLSLYRWQGSVALIICTVVPSGKIMRKALTKLVQRV